MERYCGDNSVRIDNVIFNSVVRVGVARFGDVFYDINLEVAEYLPHATNGSASDMNMATSNGSIHQNESIVNSSAKNMPNIYPLSIAATWKRRRGWWTRRRRLRGMTHPNSITAQASLALQNSNQNWQMIKLYNITIAIAKTADGRVVLYATKGKIKKLDRQK